MVDKCYECISINVFIRGGHSEVWITMTLASGVNNNSSARNNNRRQNRMSALHSRQETGARDKSKYGSEKQERETGDESQVMGTLGDRGAS